MTDTASVVDVETKEPVDCLEKEIKDLDQVPAEKVDDDVTFAQLVRSQSG